MTVRRLALRLAALATALVMAACGGGGPMTAPTQVTPTDPGLPPVVVPTFDLSSFDLPSFSLPSFTGDEELEALLPDSIGGQVVVKQSMTGQAFLDIGMGGAAALEDTLADMGASIDDLSVAFGTAGALVVIAYQIDGVSADRIFKGLQGALPSGAGGNVSQQTVAGRPVTVVVAAGETTYIYLGGEVVFIIGGAVTPQLLDDAVTQLPTG